jgi:hypothetical protein
MLNIISQGSAQGGVASLGVKSGTNASSSTDQTAARLLAIKPGTAVEDPTLGEVTNVEISPYLKATQNFQRGPDQVEHAKEAGRSMAVIEKELQNIDAMIAKNRPNLAGSNWDFKLVNGKLKVTGLAQDDTKWLEGKLNSNKALQDAAKSFMVAAAAELETTDKNPARLDYNYSTGRMENYTFYDVNEQFPDKVSFRSLLSKSNEIYDPSVQDIPDHDRGMSGLSVAATMLTATNQPIERTGAFYAVKYDPLQ